MPGSIGTSRSLVLGLGLSLVLHAGLGGLLARYGTLVAAPSLAASPTPAPLPPEESLALGIEDSSAVTETWLGFETPTEHQAHKATVEQPDLSPKPGAVAAAAAPAQPAGPPEPRDVAAATPSESQPAPAAPQDAPPPTAVAATEPDQPLPRPEEPPAQREGRQTQAEPPPAPTQPAPGAPSTQPRPEPQPRPQSQPPSAQPAQAPARPGEGSEQSERESTAAALKEAIDVKPGRPVAAKGLEIVTVRPRWSITTQIVASPKNPVVRVIFGRSGRVVRAEFVRGQSTGWPQVDDPLIDAIYRWRARGQALTKIPSDKPETGLPVVFRITLKGD